MRRTVYHWFKLFLLLSDGFIIAFVVLLVLWKLGIKISPGVIAAIAIMLLVVSFISCKVLQPVIGDKTSLSNSMIGLEGEVVRPLEPDGVVRGKGRAMEGHRC